LSPFLEFCVSYFILSDSFAFFYPFSLTSIVTLQSRRKNFDKPIAKQTVKWYNPDVRLGCKFGEGHAPLSFLLMKG
jgi:hypothetical protein